MSMIFPLGNPSVNPPKEVNEAIMAALKENNQNFLAWLYVKCRIS